MPGYLIGHLEVTNPEGFSAYRDKVPAVIAQYGGRYLVRGGEIETLEGDWTVPRLVVLAFDSVEAVKRFYHSPEYQAILPLRLENSRGAVVIAKGYAG